MNRLIRGLIPVGLVLVCCNATDASDDKPLSWLKSVITPPKTLPMVDTGTMRPLLQDTDGKPITTLAAWKKKRAALRAEWLKFLGPMPAKRPPVKLTVLKEDHPKGVLRKLVRYEAEAGQPVEGYLLIPDDLKPGEKRAGIAGLHPTTTDTIDAIAGLTGPIEKQFGLQFARRGYIVFCPRNYLWQSVTKYSEAVERFQKRHPKTLGMHKMLFDAMRGVDVLISLPQVDAGRIGAVGHSLGAKEVLYLMAFDDRVKVGVASEGGTGFRSTNWDAPWYLGKGIYEKSFALNHHELLAMIAPRAFLILAGEKGRGAADGDRSWPFVIPAQSICRLYDKPVMLGIYNHGQGHAVPPEAHRRLIEWIEAGLRE